jgi:HSP20 family molecular chaperone IbpA
MYDLDMGRVFEKQASVFKSLQKPTYPLYNLSKDENGDTVLEISCAGFDKEAFDVALDKGMLYISGSPQEQAFKASKEYLVKNLSSKAFNYSFPLWMMGGVKDIACSYDDGIFKIVMKKKAEDKISISWEKE